MKRLSICAGLVMFTMTATAADPFVGTYRLDVAKSKNSGAPPASAATLVISEQGDDLVLDISAKNSDGSILAEKTALPKMGGTLRRLDGGELRYDSVTATRTSPTMIDIVTMQGGKEAVRMKYTLSPDGKVLTRTIKGTNARGQLVDAVSVFERQ